MAKQVFHPLKIKTANEILY